ncbi:LysR family transcriptional regulator, partial [Vibrio parahaemolyticus]
MNFSLEQLLAFVAVYEQLSFSKAAVKLNKHRTTIGQVITNLEDLLAVTLFERVGRSVEPTEDARLLYH